MGKEKEPSADTHFPWVTSAVLVLSERSQSGKRLEMELG